MTDSKAPQINYPHTFQPPGPATQAEHMLECMEYFMDDHVEDYTNQENFDSPEDWVQFRSLYANIHWMYEKLVGGEGETVEI